MPIKIERKGIPDTGQVITPRGLTVSPGAFGAEEGRAFQQVGQQLTELGKLGLHVAKQMKDRDDKTAAGNAYHDFDKRAGEIENNLFSRKGMDAEGIVESGEQDIGKAHSDISGKLKNPQQRELFNARSQSRRTVFTNSVRRHKRTQLDKAYLGQAKASIKNGIQTAQENHNDDLAIENSRLDVMIGTAQIADLQGLSEEEETLLQENAISELHKGVILQRTVYDAESAKDYYEVNKEEIQGSDRLALEERIKTQGVRQQAQASTDEIYTHTEWTFEEKLDKARKISNPKIRDETVKRLKLRHQEETIIEHEAREETFSKTIKAMSGKDIKTMRDIANGLENGPDRIKALHFADSEQARRVKKIKRKTIKTDYSKLLQAYKDVDEGHVPNAEQLLATYKPYLSDGDWNKLFDYYRQGGQIGELSSASVRATYRALTGKGPGESEKHERQYAAVLDYVRDQIRIEGIKPTSDRVSAWVAESLTQGEKTGGFLFDTDMRYAEALSKGEGHLWLPDVPDNARAGIKEDLKQNGLKVDETAIRRWYKFKVLGIPPTREEIINR